MDDSVENEIERHRARDKEIMDPVSKRQKLSVETTMDIKDEEEEQCVDDDDDVDRISNLPPELIGKILSLLPTTKEAVATCVLSSTWKWFWTFITRLNFVADFSKPSLMSFINRLLLYRKPTTLDYLRIRCHGLDNLNVSHFREWLSSALLVDVKELHLLVFGNDNPSNMLPFDFFSYKKLFKLILEGGFKIDIPPVVCLPNLQLLRLASIKFCDDHSLKRLLIGCPALEELRVFNSVPTPHVLPHELFTHTKLANLVLIIPGFVMEVPTLISLPSLEAMLLHCVIFPDDDSVKRFLGGCPSLRELQIRIDGVEVLHVYAPLLSKLSVHYTGPYGCGKMVLKTPSLRYLRVNYLAIDSWESIDLNQLVEVELCHICCPGGFKAITNLIKGLANVKTLYLCGPVMEAIVKGGCQLPKFHKLTTLKLGVNYGNGWAAIPVLLEKSPLIETLVFEDGIQVKDYPLNTPWQAPQKVPYCLHHHLKVIEIKCFEGDIEGEELIRYFIENRGVFKDLTIIQYPPARPGTLWANRKTVYRRRSGKEATKKL